MKGMSLIRCIFTGKFGVFVDEKNDKLCTLYWLPNLHKIPYKSQLFFPTSCTSTELCIFFTSCL